MELENNRNPRKKRFNKKVAFWMVGIAVITFIMIYFDKQKVYKEEKPPIPVVSLGEQRTQVLLGSYVWNDGEVKKELKDLNEPLSYKRVEYRDRLNVDFPEGEEPLYIFRGLYGNDGELINPVASIFDEKEDFLGNSNSIQTLSLKAFWKNGKRAEYIIPLNIREVQPEKEYLSKVKGYHSLLVVFGEVPQDDLELKFEIHNESSYFLLGPSNSISLENAKEQYPELNIESAPSYLLFDREKEIYRTDSVDTLKHYIKDNTFVSKETVQGLVTKIDRELGMLYVEGIPYSVEDLTSVKAGQEIKLEVATISKEIPYLIVENIEVIREAKKTLSDKAWISKKDDKLSLLVVGNQAFTKPFQQPNKKDLMMVENIEIRKSLQSIEQPTIFVFNNKELVFQTHEYENLLKYLFESEQLLPLKKRSASND